MTQPLPEHVANIEALNEQAKRAQTAATYGKITRVEAGSAAEKLGIRAGDALVSLNGHTPQDVIDVQYYGAEERLEVVVLREGQEIRLKGRRQFGQSLGLHFEHPTFDIDIRRCNNLCPFCFVLQMGKGFRRTLYIKDDDYRYSFLFGHYVTLTNLSPADWQRILDQHLSPLYVSVHATDPAKRRECLRNPSAPAILPQLRELAAHGFEVHTQLVITPTLNDGAVLEQSLRELGDLYPTVASISVVPVGLTQFHKYGYHSASRAQAAAILETVEKWAAHFRARYGVGLAYCTDEYYLVTGRPFPPLAAYDGLALHENGLGMVRAFLDEWEGLQKDEVPTLQPRYQHLTLVTAALFAPILRQAAATLAAQTGLRIDVLTVLNQRLGAGITVAGLLMGEDVLAVLQNAELGQLIILPRIMFDHPDGVSLDDVSPQTLAERLGRPIALADSMGDVLDALHGQNTLTFSPQGNLIPPAKIAQDGGWAVEKYL